MKKSTKHSMGNLYYSTIKTTSRAKA